MPRGRELVSSQGLCCGAPGCRRPTEPAVQAQAAARAVAAHETGSSGSGHRRSRFTGQLDARQLRRHNYKSSVLPAKSSAHLEHRSRTRASRPGMNMGQKISGNTFDTIYFLIHSFHFIDFPFPLKKYSRCNNYIFFKKSLINIF